MKTKKELKAAYKEMKFQVGVYQIRNKINDRIFIGSSTNLEAIWNRHCFTLNMGSHRNKVLQKDWKEFGEANFVFEILEELEQKDGDGLDYNKEVTLLEQMVKEGKSPFYNSN